MSAQSPAHAITRAYQEIFGGSQQAFDAESKMMLAIVEGVEGNPFHAAARLRRWAQVLDTAARKLEESA